MLGINIRVTPEEKEKITKNAAKCRLTVSEYLRQLAMKKELREMPSGELEESLLRLRQVIHELESVIQTGSDAELRSFCVGLVRRLGVILIETLRISVGQRSSTERKTQRRGQ
jgi:hypothetical protein